MSELERLARYHVLNELTGCWVWTGSLSDDGYPKANRPDGRGGWDTVMAHRYIYELAIGPIADGAQLDHLCLVTRCVNPAHLEPVTGEENMRRRFALVTVCQQGHDYTPENTYIRPSGHRDCRECIRDRVRRYRTRARGGVA